MLNSKQPFRYLIGCEFFYGHLIHLFVVNRQNGHIIVELEFNWEISASSITNIVDSHFHDSFCCFCFIGIIPFGNITLHTYLTYSMISSMHLIQLITVRWISIEGNKTTNKKTESQKNLHLASVSMTLYHRYIKRYIIHSFISLFVTFTTVINLKSDDDKMSTVVHWN